MTTLSRFVCVATVALCIAAGAYTWYANRAKTPLPNPINETPATSTRAIVSATTTSDLIHVTNPLPNQQIQSPLVLTGEARGSWFFEASFPVVLTDWDGKIIAQGIAQAKSDWMTNNFVPFQATIVFKVDPNVYSNKGSLILRRDNPSGLPQNDNALEIPITFVKPAKPPVACTEEAKLCPDGSAVGRTGPNCEFPPCPKK